MIVLVYILLGNALLVRLELVSRLALERARTKIVCDYGCVSTIEIWKPFIRISSLEVAHAAKGLVVTNF